MNYSMTWVDKMWLAILRERGVQSVTDEWAATEIERCRKDYVYFIKSYCLIPGSRFCGVPGIELHPGQSVLLSAMATGSDLVVRKARQVGVTDSIVWFLLWRAIFSVNKNFAILSPSQRASVSFMDKLGFAHGNLPFFLRKPANWTKRKMTIGSQSDHSTILSAPATADVLVSHTVNMLVLDEAAFIRDAANIWQSIVPSLTAVKGQAVLVSTPSIMGDSGAKFFNQMMAAAESGTSKFSLVDIGWDMVGGRDEAWYDAECAKLSHDPRYIQAELDARAPEMCTA